MLDHLFTLTAQRRLAPLCRLLKKGQVPPAPLPHRLAPVQLRPRRVGHRVPIIVTDRIVGVAGLIEQPRQLLVIDRDTVLGLAGAAVSARGTAEDVAAAAGLELDSAVQALSHEGSGGRVFFARSQSAVSGAGSSGLAPSLSLRGTG